jgi:uncharacterized protein YbjT (DUF2867 family)
MSEILVTGGTGHLGRELVPLLVTKGHNVKVLSRKTGPQVVQGDLVTGDGIADAVKGIDVLVHCATGAADNGARGLGYELSKKTDVEPTERLVKLLGPSTHVVYPSIVGVDKIPLGYYRAKLDVEQILERSGLPYTILRSTQWHTLGEEFCRRLTSFPLVMPPRGVKLQLLDPSEVAARMASLVERGPSGHAPDMGGPKALEFKDVVRTWLRARRKKRLVLAAPFPGKAIKAFRAGYNLTPEHADGTITWDQWLAANPA